PAGAAGGIAQHQGEGGHVFRDHRPRPHEGVAADGHAAHDGGVGADGGALAHARGPGLVLARALPARVGARWDPHGRPAGPAALQDHPRVQADVVLDLAAVPDVHAGRHQHVLPDRAVAPDLAVAHDVAEVPDLRPRPDPARQVDVAALVNEVIL